MDKERPHIKMKKKKNNRWPKQFKIKFKIIKTKMIKFKSLLWINIRNHLMMMYKRTKTSN